MSFIQTQADKAKNVSKQAMTAFESALKKLESSNVIADTIQTANNEVISTLQVENQEMEDLSITNSTLITKIAAVLKPAVKTTP